MLRNIAVFLITFSVSISIADTEFVDSVPLDLVKALLGNTPYGEPTIYSDLSSAFPEIDVPDEFEIMGSIERGYSMTAVYSTDLAGSQIKPFLIQSFIQAGYIEFEIPGMRRSQSGFVRPSVTSRQEFNRYCHDSLGFLSLTYSEQEQGGTVTISANPTNDNRSCADQLAEQQLAMSQMGGRQSGLQQYLPRMELPATKPEPLSFNPFFNIGGYSGSSNGIEIEASLDIDWEIEEVFNHFSEQISSQDWIIDSENIGTFSATGSWTRSPEPGTDLIGTFTVLKLGEESFELKFQLTSIGGNNNSGFGIFRIN